jgi:tRNA-uridine 2-sulfurtransferase
MKTLVAMSGGVDSSVAAAMLVDQGHDVTGVHLRLAPAHAGADDGRVHGCCGLTDADDARRVAQVLGIPFYVWNMRDAFDTGIVDDFLKEYSVGRTPNPCVRCNEKVKFGHLLDRAEQLGFDAVVTGHYARNDFDGSVWRLRRAADAAKDQSYVLARTPQSRLAKCRFPLGEFTKPQVREMATKINLRTANKPESYDICFIPDGDTAGFLERSLGAAPGPIVDTEGHVVGEHQGVHRFTIGQRRGLGLASHRRLHVVELEAATGTVVVGDKEDLNRTELTVDEIVWTSGHEQDFDFVQIRAHAMPAKVQSHSVEGDLMTIGLSEPITGVAPGQLVACYKQDEVVAGATLSSAR